MATYTNPTTSFNATDGDDTITFTTRPSGTITIDALGGHDSLVVQFDNPNALGFNVADLVNSGEFQVMISGELTDPRITAYNFENVDLHGTVYDDTFSLTVGPNSSGLTVSMDGGAGQDYLQLDFSSTATALSFVAGASISTPFGTFTNFEKFWVSAGSGDDTITTTNADDYIIAGSGSDVVSAGDGNNTIFGGAGNDNLTAGAGNDGIAGNAGNDTVAGGGGIDSISGGAGADTIDGGDGADTIYGDDYYMSADDGADHITGGLGNDYIHGGGADDTIDGGADNDVLLGGRGSDHIEGGDGNDAIDGFGESGYGIDDLAADVLIGGAGDDGITAGWGDSVDGGTGTDSLAYSGLGGTTGINVNFSQLTSGGTVTIAGATLSGIEYVNGIGGTDYSDTIIAGASNATSLYINGYGGDDALTGTSGHDLIDGGDGNDVIAGGLGVDVLTGGNGTDTFIGTAAALNNDSITSIEVGEKIVITDANPTTFSFSFDHGTLYYSGGVIGIGGDIPGKLVASAALGGGVQITVEPLPVASVDRIAAQLTSDFWSWLGEDAHHFNVTQGGTITVDIHTLNADEQTLARAAFGEWRDIIGVNFQEVTSGAQILITNEEDPTAGGAPSAYTEDVSVNGVTQSAHVHISSSWVTAYETPYGNHLDNYAFQTYVHEIGHALGLGHTGDYNFDADYQTGALFANDAWSMSVMSYFDQEEAKYFWNQGFSYAYAVTPMQADIVAMQSLYGLSTTTRTGDTVYGYNSNAGGVYDANSNSNVAFTIFDSGGNDTLDYSGFGGFQRIDLNPEAFSWVNGLDGMVSIARGVIIENAIGGGGIDMITGNAADNVITGGFGNDTLTGGAGNDIFKDTAAGLSGDTITDFGVGDSIVIADAALAGFTYGLSGTTLTYAGGSLTLANAPQGAIVASAVATGGVALRLVQHDPANDFNGDGRSDILWRDASTGQITDWLAAVGSGFTDNYNNARANVGTGWQVVGTGDFNGDHRDDILWRNTSTGQITDWLGRTNGGFTDNYNASKAGVPLNWQVAGTGDFNGDGRDDILWRSDTGVITDWLGNANGSFTSNYAGSAVNVPTEWRIAGTGDFNGDGRTDILWRSGSLTVDWLANANGGFVANWNNSVVTIPTDWTVAGVGDFNGDGRDDILWRNGAGVTVDWLANASGNGGFSSNYANSAVQVATTTSIASIGDFNGDGRDDILWRDSSGTPAEWFANSSGGFTDHFGLANVPTAWHIEPQASLV
jgi:Ca2+-binding RTX toxin-like protein